MTTPLDRELAERLERLAAAVPVRDNRLDPVHASAVRARQNVRMSWLTPLVALVVLVLIAGVVGIGSLNVLNGPVSVTTRLGEFTLTLASAKARYRTGEVVDIRASLLFEGAAEQIQIAHAGSGPLGFGMKEPVQGYSLSPAWRASCRQTQLTRGLPFSKPFSKSGGYDGPDQAGFARFIQEPTLALPSGTWHPYVVAEFSLGECDGERITMRAELTIEVVDSPTPTDSPIASTAVDAADAAGSFELRLESARNVYLSTEPVEVSAALRYVGPAPSVTVRYIGRSPVTFAIAGGPPGPILQPRGRWACEEQLLVRGVPLVIRMGDYADAQRAFPLPANVWDVSAAAEISLGSCTSGSLSLEASIKVEVRDDLAVPMIDLETATQPASACPLMASGGWLARDSNTGLGTAWEPGGDSHGVRWPYGWTARLEDGLALLVDPDGHVVAREGERVEFGGARVGQVFTACTGVRVVGPDKTP